MISSTSNNIVCSSSNWLQNKSLQKIGGGKLRFSGFRKFVTRPAFRELRLMQISLNIKTSCCNLKIRGLFYYFNFGRNYDVLKSKSPCIFLNKNINFNKNETESIMENPTHSFRETNLVLYSSYKNRKLKLKLWRFRARERK